MSALRDQIDAGKWAMVEARDVPSVRHCVASCGDKPFMVWEPFEGSPATYSYAQFGAAVESPLVRCIRRVQIGDRILVHLDNSPSLSSLGLRVRARGGRSVDKYAPVARDMSISLNMLV